MWLCRTTALDFDRSEAEWKHPDLSLRATERGNLSIIGMTDLDYVLLSLLINVPGSMAGYVVCYIEKCIPFRVVRRFAK